MVIGRKNRRAERSDRVASVIGAPQLEAALDALELMEFAWHDCYGQPNPPEDVVDDVLTVSRGNLADLVSAALLAVTDRRDLRIAAERVTR